MAETTIGYSAILSLNTTGSFVDIAETVMIQLPAIEVSSIESTHLGVEDGFKTYVPGLKNAGTFSFECNYSPTTYALLDGIRGLKKVSTQDVTWQITGPELADEQTFTFKGFVTKTELSFEPETIAKIKCEVQVDGPVTLG